MARITDEHLHHYTAITIAGKLTGVEKRKVKKLALWVGESGFYSRETDGLANDFDDTGRLLIIAAINEWNALRCSRVVEDGAKMQG